jgi:hypothetical protein
VKLTRWFLPSLLGLLLSLVLVSPVLAAINPPDSISINGVWVYRGCKETGDQLYIVDYTIDYTTLPDETSAEAYMCRLLQSNTTLGYASPYPYHDKGYGRGVVAIYFSAAAAPAWQGNFTMELLGSPFCDWNGTLPSYTVVSSNFSLWQDAEPTVQKVAIAGKIIYLATILQGEWGENMTSLSQTGQTVLTPYAAAYFVNVIPYLGDIAPSVFPGGQSPGTSVTEPEIPGDTSGQDYATWLESIIGGTPFDLSGLAANIGVSRGALTAVLYYGVVVFILIVICRGLGTYKPMMWFALPFVAVGAFLGVPLIATILVGLANLTLIGFALFYKPSNA